MTVVARTSYAIGVFVVFGSLAFFMGRSAMRDWRQGRRDHDTVTLLSAAQQWWPAALAAAVAIAGPAILLVRG